MKKLLTLLFTVAVLSYSQTETISTVEGNYQRQDLGLHINWIFPGECLFYWCGIFKPAAVKAPYYLESVELAFAFERFDTTSTHDILVVDVFRGDTSLSLLSRYGSYQIDLGTEGFPKNFSSDMYSQYYDTYPSFKTIKFSDLQKILKIKESYFIIGIRILYPAGRAPYYVSPSQKIWLPNSGLNIGKVEYPNANIPKKELSRRYMIYSGSQENPASGKLVPAFPKDNWTIYMKATVSSTPSISSMVVDSFSTNPYKCEKIITAIDNIEGVEKEYELSQNYPNPFNPQTTIKYEIKQQCNVKIDILNLLGQKIKTLLDTKQDAGSYVIPFDATGFSTGLYFYKISAFNGNSILFTETKKMSYIK
jgi:hypothetical protein